ncbi:NXPE family member 4-like [Protopterus annectens]|uniref:NXPE family member 4-like n=1 Tax=Protopterus annectens TaxID=7888 RepID=UPI001CFAC3A3|nr:NXPE family member 4-like [Protopterus annectens]
MESKTVRMGHIFLLVLVATTCSFIMIGITCLYWNSQCTLLESENLDILLEKTFWHTVPSVIAALRKESAVLFQNLSSSEPCLDYLNFNKSSSGRHSRYYLSTPLNTYSVGEVISIYVKMYDHLGQKMSSGGDFIIARLYSNISVAGTTGSVLDLNNGDYLITFPLYWEGRAWISVKLYHPAQAISLLRMLRENFSHRSAFKGIFVFKHMREETNCSCDQSVPTPLCDFTDKTSEVPWFCSKPQELECEHLKYLQCYTSEEYLLNEEESKLLNSDNILMDILPAGPASIFVKGKARDTPQTPCVVKPLKLRHSNGFVFNGIWSPAQCQMQSFHSESTAVQCLKGKQIYLIGDSTIRQWWDYLVRLIPSLNVFHRGKIRRTDRHLALDFVNDIYLQWTPHELPWETGEEYIFLNMQPTVNQINSLFGGPEYIIVLSVGAHFTPYSLKLYIERLIRIRNALKNLLTRNSETTIILKTINTRKVYTDILFRSDWLSYQLNKALFEIFKGMNVGLIDAWDMTIAYNSWAAHPPLQVVKNEVDLLLSYICSKKKNHTNVL